MFKSAATKIAHNSTLPSLAIAGNKDLRPLQDLITAEKSIVQSLLKLSTDFTKASEALKHWAVGEGDDLGVSLYLLQSGFKVVREKGFLIRGRSRNTQEWRIFITRVSSVDIRRKRVHLHHEPEGLNPTAAK